MQREIEVSLWKTDFLMGDFESEKVFQLFSFPVKDMVVSNPHFDYSAIVQIDFVFDLTEKGVVVVDNIGFMKSLRL